MHLPSTNSEDIRRKTMENDQDLFENTDQHQNDRENTDLDEDSVTTLSENTDGCTKGLDRQCIELFLVIMSLLSNLFFTWVISILHLKRKQMNVDDYVSAVSNESSSMINKWRLIFDASSSSSSTGFIPSSGRVAGARIAILQLKLLSSASFSVSLTTGISSLTQSFHSPSRPSSFPLSNHNLHHSICLFPCHQMAEPP